MAGQINRPDTAFSTDRIGLFRRPQRSNKKHLQFVASLPSLIPGTGRIDPAHIKFRAPLYAKRGVGGAERPDDCWVVPLHRSVHDQQHNMNEKQFWREQGINPLLVAALLWLHSGDEEAATIVIRNARSIGEAL